VLIEGIETSQFIVIVLTKRSDVARSKHVEFVGKTQVPTKAALVFIGNSLPQLPDGAVERPI